MGQLAKGLLEGQREWRKGVALCLFCVLHIYVVHHMVSIDRQAVWLCVVRPMHIAFSVFNVCGCLPFEWCLFVCFVTYEQLALLMLSWARCATKNPLRGRGGLCGFA